MTSQEAAEKWCAKNSTLKYFQENDAKPFRAGWKAGYAQAIEDAIKSLGGRYGASATKDIRALGRGKENK